ncbi:MAG: ParA family protein [candidate division Zixibacteria bacterium]|nr:ParA family protein [candidate division Zixibacteria bacterium]
MHKIAIIASKGGTGKTTTAINFAHAVALMGQKVLLVDSDSQGSASLAFDLNGVQGLSDLLLSGQVDIYDVRPNLYLVGSGRSDIFLVERYLAQQLETDYPLAKALERFTGVDIVILDCSPSINIINSNVLCYVDTVLIPVSMDYFALEGAGLTLKLIREMSKNLDKEIQLLGILPTFFDVRTKISKTILNNLRERYKNKVFDSTIRVNTQIKESQMNNKTIFEYAPYSHGAYDYYRFVKEALKRLSKVGVYE